MRLPVLWCLLLSAAVETTAAAAPLAYVLVQRDDDPGPGTTGQQTLLVIDTATDGVVASIPLGLSCFYCFKSSTLALSPDGSRVFIANQVSGTVSVVDVATHTVVGLVSLGGAPNGVVLSPDGTSLYVLNGTSVAVVDATTLAVTRAITLPTPPTATGGLAITPSGAHLYIADFGRFRLFVVNTATGTTGTIPLPDRPVDLDITQDGSEVYVAAGNTNRVFVVSTAANAVAAEIVVGTTDLYPVSVRPSVNAAQVYVANLRGYSLSVIDRATRTVVGTVPQVPNARTLDFVTDGSRAFVTTLSSVTIVDVATGTVRGAIPVPLALGEPTTIVIADPPPTAPAAPTGLAAWSIAGNTVTLRWAAPATAPTPTAYMLEGGTLPGEVLKTLPTGSANPIFTFEAPSGAFYVRVRGVNGSTAGPPSNEIRIFVNVPQRPSAPSGFTGAVSGRAVALTWRDTFEGGAATSHALDVTGAVAATLPLGPAESIAFDNVPAGTYTLVLRALNAAGSSVPSNAVTLTIPGECSGPPSPPADFIAYRDGRRVTVLWNPAPAGPATTDYVLGVSGALSMSIPTAGRSLSGVVGPGTYVLSVAGSNACGQGSPTSTQVVSVP